MAANTQALDFLNWQKYRVNRPGQPEIISQPLYDTALYAAAGQTSLTFFQVPVGQSSKTLADTNMEIAGSLPQPKIFLCTGIEIYFFPNFTLKTVSTGPAADAPLNNWNDQYTFRTAPMWLDFFIGSKSYLKDGPAMKFPPSTRLAGDAAVTSTLTAGAATMTKLDYAEGAGRHYAMTPVALESNQNFSLSLNWPVAVALPSTVTGRVLVNLCGYTIRLSQ